MIKFSSIALLTLVLQSDLCNQIHLSHYDAQEISRPSEESLRVGTWNLKRLGNGSKRYDLVAKIIEDNMDVVSLQEVMNPEGLRRLLDLLPGWAGALSSKVGRNGYFEYYAVIARRDKVSFVSNRIVKDDLDFWAREPLVTCMKASKVDFCMVTTHVVYGDSVAERDEEIRQLSFLLDKLIANSSEKDYLLVGDFNRETTAKSFKSFLEKGFRVADSSEKTTLGDSSYSNSYDHIILNINKSHWDYPARRIDVVESVCMRNFRWCSTNVSDHSPVVIKIKNG
jgi:endonuclease/exonuclease/phosphatase family metal-dependent hydrolase